MTRKLIAAALLATAPFIAFAQGASAPVSAAKKELVAKIVKAQQPGVEAFARQIVQQNTVQVLQAAGQAVQQRVTADRRDAVWQDIQADGRKFAEESFPIVRDRAVKIAPTVFTPLLEERFTEDELKQLLALLESPVGKKFASMNGEIMRSMGEKLMADVKPTMEPKMQAFQKTVAGRLAPAASAPGGK